MFDQHRRFLWGLLYRMTGDAGEAEDLVQDTFVRFLESGPDLFGESSARPWLARVGLNLARDALRRRRRAPYVGPWLPSPVIVRNPGALRDGGDRVLESFEVEAGGVGTEGRYDLLESMSMAFLVALEELTPQQRAVLLLRDVFDYSVRETASVLGSREDAVKSAHRRARRAMQAYRSGARHDPASRRERCGAALVAFVTALATGDRAGLEGLLAADVRAVSDGGGVVYAALRPVVGPGPVSRLYEGIFRKFAGRGLPQPVEVGGLPAILVEVPEAAGRLAPRFLLQVDVDDDGAIRGVYAVLAPAKLARLA